MTQEEMAAAYAEGGEAGLRERLERAESLQDKIDAAKARAARRALDEVAAARRASERRHMAFTLLWVALGVAALFLFASPGAEQRTGASSLAFAVLVALAARVWLGVRR